jgi:hypothetical protein
VAGPRAEVCEVVVRVWPVIRKQILK